VLTPVTPHRPGAAFALLTDPDGNVLEILQEDPT
jgi:predicted enzyme related to lactoylglutathione lyase